MMLFMPLTAPVNVTVRTRLLSLSIKHLDIWLDSKLSFGVHFVILSIKLRPKLGFFL